MTYDRKNVKRGLKPQRYILSHKTRSEGSSYALLHLRPQAHLITQDCLWSFSHSVHVPGGRREEKAAAPSESTPSRSPSGNHIR